MKKHLFFLFAILATTPIKGQVAKWLIPPAYDDIHKASGTDLIIADSLNNKVLWTQSGKRLSSTPDVLFPFVDHFAVTTKRGSGTITGFYGLDGKFTPLSNCSVTYAKPYFSDSYLLVLDDDFYRFVNSKGEKGEEQYTTALPFSNGYASCTIYKNIQKKKDPYNLMITKEKERVAFFYDGKQFDDDDLEFISSVNDENIGIVVAKHKVYFFNGKTRELSPVYASKDEVNIKKQAKLENELPLCLISETDTTYVLTAKCGKEDKIQIRFDNLFVPMSVSSANEKHEYRKNEKPEVSYTSPLKIVVQDNKCGINWESQEVLPPQFDELMTCFDNMAFVKLSKKCGMIKVYKDEKFRITINKGNPIDFRHQKYETTIRLDLPKAISAFNTRIEINPNSGCEVDMPSGDKKDTEDGNFIQYNCVLNIPQSLPDEMYGDSRNEITYPTQILYDGLKSPVILSKVKAWHYKYFNVDVNDSETSINKGTLSFSFDINAERTQGEAVYPTTVNVQADSLQWELEKLSETRYKCKVFELNEGNNNIVVQILEEGCPPASFPFEVTYIRPSVKSKTKGAAKEDVVIKKKTRKSTPTPTPHLDI